MIFQSPTISPAWLVSTGAGGFTPGGKNAAPWAMLTGRRMLALSMQLPLPAGTCGGRGSATQYEPEVAQNSMQLSLDQAKIADEAGFDWISVAEHHFAPFSVTPNPMVMAGAMSQVVKRATDPHGEIEIWGHHLAGLSDLVIAGHAAGIADVYLEVWHSSAKELRGSGT